MAESILFSGVIATLFILYIITFGFFASLVIYRNRKREEMEDVFLSALKKGLQNQSIKKIDDVINIYKGIYGLSSDDTSYRSSVIKSLRFFLANVIGEKESVDDDGHKASIIQNWNDTISKFIIDLEKTAPFSDLPGSERNLLKDIITFVENGDKESANRKISELAGILQAKHTDLEKIRSTNKWSVPLAVIGLILTLIFGLVKF
jgi:hypothetical protein